MRHEPPRIGSLCTGYAGLDLAVLAVLGGHLVWVADPDPAAARLLAARLPEVPNLGDITTTDWAQIPRVDIVTAGWPCQDISHAGTRAGITGTRSGLWRHIIAAVRVLRPRLVFLENVAALRTRGLDTVQADLATLRYDTAWTCLRASEIGAAHQRDRIFILATTETAASVVSAAGTGAGVADAVRPRRQRRRPPP